MPTNEQPTAEELFDFVMTRLVELQAIDQIAEIKRTISRGVVSPGQSESSRTYRPMHADEKLSVALEFVVTAFDVPVMLARCREVLGGEEVRWAGDEAEQRGKSPASPPDSREFDALRKLVSIIDELLLPIPEVA